MPTITDQRKIDDKAKAIFRNLMLDSSWLIREENPDVHIDYVIEPVENDEPTGERFCVQLKGALILKQDSLHIKQIIETKHLLYYLEKSNLPVFIVSVDITTKEAYWIFAQEILMTDNVDRKLKKQATITINIPRENNLNNFSVFASKICESHSYMKKMRPGSINDAIQAEKNRLKKLGLEKDFITDISYANEKTSYVFSPKAGSLPVTMLMKSSGSHKKYERVMNTGRAETFTADEVEILGLPGIKPSAESACFSTTILQAKDTCNLSIFSLLNGVNTLLFAGLKADFYFGRTEMSFDYEDKNSPLMLSYKLTRAKTLNCHFQLWIDPCIWVGMPILNLPYFDSTVNLIDSINADGKIEIIISKNGNNIQKIVTKPTQHLNESFIFLIKKFRKICEKSGQNYKLPPLNELETYIQSMY